jgi:lipopolysaccharide/colanic/teichoic acid biosynthesis glycosyltransferase
MTILDLLQKKQRKSHYRREIRDDLTDRYNGMYKEHYFCELLSIERKRSERSRKPFLLMLADLNGFEDRFERHQISKRIGDALSSATRDTDIKGWFKYDCVIGVMFTDIAVKDKNIKHGHKHLVNKCSDSLGISLGEDELERVVLTWHVFPGQFDKVFADEPGHTMVYPDLLARRKQKKFAHFIKRVMDIFGSLLLIAFLSPIFLCIAGLIKLGSAGPVLFKQERIGLFGKRFMFLKFRSMFVGNNPTIHQDFVKSLIRGKQHGVGSKETSGQGSTYKITNDPRVTPLGYFLRRSSLDELPQFFNVLRGEMSLVGPRPPIPYECENYDIWHRKRMLEMKPGITGFWQVNGRSRTTFDEMVRMDIQYTREWSLWLDIKILLKTPWVVINGKGAY